MYIFEVWDGETKIATHSVPAKSEQQAWDIFGMGLSDYPPKYRVILRQKKSEKKDS